MGESDRREGGTSYLLRLWREPRARGDQNEPVRVYLRDLRSGEERYLKNTAALADFLDRRTQRAARKGEDGTAANRRQAG